MEKGILYIVATPIGNLEDITLRAIDTLKKVDFILAEDTRYTAKLLQKYEIKTQMVSYRDQNHDRMIGKVLEKLNLGLNLALVSDSGTPVISDPGFKLVRELKDKGFKVLPIPGPSATISALSVSGLATDRFLFLGFLPKSDKKREDILTQYANIEATIVIYESPQRVVGLLESIKKALGSRMVTVANDMTKLYERVETKPVDDMISEFLSGSFNSKGEFVVLIGKE